MRIDDKRRAIELRRSGKSYRSIENELGIAKSTLSGWLKDVHLTQAQSKRLHQNWLEGLERARKMASQVHVTTKKNSINMHKREAKETVNSMKIDKNLLEIMLVGLYLGDGFKVNGRVGLGNSNPRIVKLFLTLIRVLYTINEDKIRVQIFARMDQKETELIQYWSDLLTVPMTQFHKTQFDKRTAKSKTKSNYYGVCAVSVSNMELQRHILALGDQMVKYVNNRKWVRSSVG
jgi:hypothetical protein